MIAAKITHGADGYRTQIETADGHVIGTLCGGDHWSRVWVDGQVLTKWYTNGMRESDDEILAQVNKALAPGRCEDISFARFNRRDDWIAYDITNGRDDARYLGMIPAVFAKPYGAPIFAD